MRWFWIDRFTEFVSGQSAVAVKNVSLAEEHLLESVPGFPHHPASLIIEGLAQTAGLLAGEASGFEARVVLAKIGKAVFHRLAVPGDQLTFVAKMEDIKSTGAIAKGECRVGQELLAEIELVFAHLDDRFHGVELFEPVQFLAMLRMLRVFEVGRKRDGSPLEVPPRLLAAERAACEAAERAEKVGQADASAL